MGAKDDQKHVISTQLCLWQRVWVYTMLCVLGQSVQALIVKIFMPETRTYHKYKDNYIYGHYTDSRVSVFSDVLQLTECNAVWCFGFIKF